MNQDVQWATVGQAWRGEGKTAVLARLVRRARLRCDIPVDAAGGAIEAAPLVLTMRVIGDDRGDHGWASAEVWLGPDINMTRLWRGEWPHVGDAAACCSRAENEVMRWLEAFTTTPWTALPVADAEAPFTG